VDRVLEFLFEHQEAINDGSSDAKLFEEKFNGILA